MKTATKWHVARVYSTAPGFGPDKYLQHRHVSIRSDVDLRDQIDAIRADLGLWDVAHQSHTCRLVTTDRDEYYVIVFHAVCENVPLSSLSNMGVAD